MNEKTENLKTEETEDPKKKVALSIRTEPEIKKWVEEKASGDERSVSIYLTRLLREMMNKERANTQS